VNVSHVLGFGLRVSNLFLNKCKVPMFQWVEGERPMNCLGLLKLYEIVFAHPSANGAYSRFFFEGLVSREERALH
jgi:hypothetical protein